MNTILVIDDDQAIRDAVSYALRGAGYAVETAASGEEALEKLEHMKNEPCLVLLDLMMPGMDGVEFLKVLDEAHRLATLPVVVVSGHPHDAAGIGARKLIRKPVSLDVLLSVVRDFCDEP